MAGLEERNANPDPPGCPCYMCGGVGIPEGEATA
jgi:hypothetical protein